MTSAVTDDRPRRARAAGRAPPRAGATVIDGAVLVATAAGDGGGPRRAAAVGATRRCSGRLLDQLAEPRHRATSHVVTRPAWAARRRGGGRGRARVHACDGHRRRPARDRGASRAEADGALVVAYADIVTQREALAGLLADPRVATGMLTTTVRRVGRYVGFADALAARPRRQRAARRTTPSTGRTGRSSACSRSRPPTAPRSRGRRAARRARRRPTLPAGWQEELEHKARALAARAAPRALRALDDPSRREDELGRAARGGAEEHERTRRRRARRRTTPPSSSAGARRAPRGRRRAAARAGSCAPASTSAAAHLRGLFWARPLSPAASPRAAERDRASTTRTRRCSTRPSRRTDGFFTTFFVCPYSRYIARWAARRG